MIDTNKEQKIKVLEDAVINKIAAGEVVERPASIVKELVENAIDAGATRIKIDLEEGGKKSLVVTDNGLGLSKEDMPLSIVRHATSKIGDIKDLFSVKSMGFRGEALASISSVSRFTLISRKKGASKAYKLSFDSEHSSYDIKNWSAPEGTCLSISDLFYNVPVRLKFLKSAQTEFSHCLEAIQALALANPRQTFILKHNGKEKFLASSNSTWDEKKENTFWGESLLRSRISYLYGKDIADRLLYVSSSSEYVSLEALIAPPGLDKATSKAMFSFVNNRWVKDRVIRYGVLRGYHSHILKGKFPYSFCYLTLSPELVDVNVHPSKTELRFEYADEVQGQLARTIRDALRKEEWASSDESSEEVSIPQESISQLATKPSSSMTFSSAYSPSSSSSLGSSHRAPNRFSSELGGLSFSSSFSSNSVSKFSSPKKKDFSSFSEGPLESVEEKVSPDYSSWVDWDELNYIGTSLKCYLIFESGSQLLFVDQHAFHERILYEKLCKDDKMLKTGEILLIPETLTFEASLVATLLENKKEIEGLSFSFEKISEEEIEVTKIPSLLQNRDLQEIFSELAETDKGSLKRDEFHHLLLATIACHSAVRSGDLLTEERVKYLMSQAKGVDFSANCPHGRRVFKWFSSNEVKAWFDRT